MLPSVRRWTGGPSETVPQLIRQTGQHGVVLGDELAVAGIGEREPDREPCFDTLGSIWVPDLAPAARPRGPSDWCSTHRPAALPSRRCLTYRPSSQTPTPASAHNDIKMIRGIRKDQKRNETATLRVFWNTKTKKSRTASAAATRRGFAHNGGAWSCEACRCSSGVYSVIGVSSSAPAPRRHNRRPTRRLLLAMLAPAGFEVQRTTALQSRSRCPKHDFRTSLSPSASSAPLGSADPRPLATGVRRNTVSRRITRFGEPHRSPTAAPHVHSR